MATKSVKSYAKINVSLRVVSKRSDGYHELDSLMLPIELHDSLIISTLKNSYDNFVTVDDFSNGLIHYNLASSSIQALAKKYGFDTKFRVYIHKVIPMQAGLGGGSSNAAFTMKAVIKQLKLNVPDETLYDALTVSKKDVYNTDKIDETVNALRGVVADHGYAFISVEPITDKHDDEKIANISTVIEPFLMVIMAGLIGIVIAGT